MRRTIKDYFTLYRSRGMARARLTEDQIRYLARCMKKGRAAAEAAREMGVSARHVRRLWARLRSAGGDVSSILPKQAGRPRAGPPEPWEVGAVLKAHKAGHGCGVVRTRRSLHDGGCNISYARVYQIMRNNGLIVPSKAKSGRRKWVRFERRYSNAMWHVDWHALKDSRFRGFSLVAYLDDASRCITAARVFKEATSENAVLALQDAIARFGVPATILSDNGSCFVGRGGRKNSPKGKWKPTVFESALLDLGIELINARPYHPQTNGKLERFFRSLEEELAYDDSLSSYIRYYNEKRLHFSLDIDRGERPLEAFYSKRTTKAIRKNNPQWMEEDA